MQIDRERIMWLALGALDELIEQAREAPIPPSLSVRVILAAAHACSDGNRQHFVSFWREMQNPHAYDSQEHSRSYVRQTMMRASLRGIVRSLGLPDTPETDARMMRMWRKDLPPVREKKPITWEQEVAGFFHANRAAAKKKGRRG